MTDKPTTRIDARGLMCPRPIIELAKAKRRAESCATIEIVADDLAFESDVRAWCKTTGNTLAILEREGDKVTARIELSA